MKLNVFDRSNYLKGLLVLISKDKKISDDESDFIMKVGKTLGFDREFCEEAIETLLENNYISQEPPEFSNVEFARSFIEDALSVAITDNELSQLEIGYLKAIAEKNHVDDDWFVRQLSTADKISKNIKFELPHLSVEKHL
ncbi:MAG TPA: TerB family tellurite resistance protein [Ignavibacteria bacterium]|nr:TerB family tellurite resistance protein [Ignavibacteria bacterium]